MQSNKIVTIAVVALFCVAGFGCAASDGGSTSVKVGPNGTDVTAGGVKVQTNDNGVKVDMGTQNGTKIETNDSGVRVNTGNVDVNTGKDGVEVDM